MKKAAEGRQEESSLRQLSEDIVTRLQNGHNNIVLQEELKRIEDKLQFFEKKKVSGQKIRSRIKWAQVGDKYSKEFFQAHMQRSSAAHITELVDANMQTHTNQPDLVRISHAYYQKLYTARDPPLVVDGAQAQSLSCIGNRLSEEAKFFLSA